MADLSIAEVNTKAFAAIPLPVLPSYGVVSIGTLKSVISNGSLNATLDWVILQASESEVAGYPLVSPISKTASQSGILLLDASQSNTIIVSVTEPITSISFVGFPTSGAQRITVYFEQDSAGNHPIGGWTAVKWQSAQPPVFSITPGAIDCAVFDSVDGGVTMLGNLVGLDYA